MSCDCDTACPGSAHCIAIWLYDKGVCWSLCQDATSAAGIDLKQVLDSEVDIEVKAMSLARVAEFLSGRVDAEILVPAARINEAVDLIEKKTYLRAVVEKMGLVVR